MEAAAEKKRRGRPPKFSPQTMKLAEENWPLSRRASQDRIYAGLVISDLMEQYEDDRETLDWLVNDDTARWSILSELGRLREQRGEEAFWEAAEWVLEKRPKVKEAVRLLRRLRTGAPPTPGSERELQRELVRTIDDYLSRRPKTTRSQIESALETTLELIRGLPSD